MGAIYGCLFRDGRPVEGSTVDAMSQVLAHRGPRDDRIVSGTLAMGHRTLGETAVARGDHGLIVAAEARLDNRFELAAQLEPGATDAAGLILRAYRRWGEDCPGRLLGDFAFAVWDPMKKRVFCARDPFGVKPLAYHVSKQAFVFGTEYRPLFASGEVPRRLEPRRVADYLSGSFEDRELTFFADVLRLPAGHSLTVGLLQQKLRCYWRPDPVAELRLPSDEAYADAFLEAFDRAVDRRLDGPAAVGAFLSGGLDSSAIACSAAHRLRNRGGGPLQTFSAIFPGLSGIELQAIDERGYIDAVTGTGGMRSHLVRGDRLSPLADVEKMVWHQEEAVLAPNQYLHWEIFQQAGAAGVGPILDGIDGDTTVSHGLEGLHELARRGRFLGMFAEARALARRSPRKGVSAWDVAWRHGLRPAAPNWMARISRLSRRGSAAPDEGWIDRDFARQVGLEERRRALESRVRRPGSAREAHRDSIVLPVYQALFEGTDRAAAAFGVEPRYPFFDRQLVELCLSLPADQKLRDGWTRFVLRRALAGRVPDEVRWRRDKANLAPNFRRRLVEADRDLLQRALADEDTLRPFVDLERVRGRLQRTLAGQRGHEIGLFAVAMLSIWLRRAGLGG